MDRMGADFDKCIEMIKDRLIVKPAITQLPIGSEENFKGVIDLVKNKAITWKEEKLGAEFEIVDIPEEYKDNSEKARNELIELVVEQDNEIMEKYLNGDIPTEEELKTIDVPMVIVPGNDDVHLLSAGENLHRILPDSEFHPPMHTPEERTKLMEIAPVVFQRITAGKLAEIFLPFLEKVTAS